MKIVFIVPDISTSGGVEKVVSQLTHYLQEKGAYQLTILNCVPLSSHFFYPIHPHVTVQSLNCPAYPASILGKLDWYWRLAKLIGQYLSNHETAIAIAEGGYVAACLSLCKTKNFLKVGSEHVSFNAVHPIHRLIRRLLFKKLDALVVLTAKDQQYYQRFMKEVFLIPNFIKKLPEDVSHHDQKEIIACGRLVPQKGFYTLIDAFKIVNQTHPHWRLKIFGEGPDRTALEQQRDNAGLNKNIDLLGETKEIDSNFKNASIFVLSSRFEGFPLALLEAMSFGLCCISTDIDGVKALVEPGINGILVSPQHPLKMARAINAMISDKEGRKMMGAAARSNATNYQLDHVGLQWEIFFKQLMK